VSEITWSASSNVPVEARVYEVCPAQSYDITLTITLPRLNDSRSPLLFDGERVIASIIDHQENSQATVIRAYNLQTGGSIQWVVKELDGFSELVGHHGFPIIFSADCLFE
jgi:alpha-mannosidase